MYDLEYVKIVGGRLLIRHVLVTTDVHADHTAAFRFLQTFGHPLGAFVIKPEPVDQRIIRGQPEKPRLLVAWLRPTGDRTDLDKSKPKRRELIDDDAILIEPSRDTERVRELKTETPDLAELIVARAFPEQASSDSKGRYADLMRGLGVEPENNRSNK